MEAKDKRYFVTVFVDGKSMEAYYSHNLDELAVTKAMFQNSELAIYDTIEQRNLSGGEIAHEVTASRKRLKEDRKAAEGQQYGSKQEIKVKKQRNRSNISHWCVPVVVPEVDMVFRTIRECSKVLKIPYMTIKNCIIRGNATRDMHFLNANENVIMYLARDRMGQLHGFSQKPVKVDEESEAGHWSAPSGSEIYTLDSRLFPRVRWEDRRPTKVKISIDNA